MKYEEMWLAQPGGRGGLANIGSAHELTVCADLIAHGYYVYRAVGHHGPFDLMAYKDGESLRIEVRGVRRRPDGTFTPVMRRRDECDLYAFVSPDGQIEYQGSDRMPPPWIKINKAHPDWEKHRCRRRRQRVRAGQVQL